MGLLSRLAGRGLAVAAVLHEPALARLGCNKGLLFSGGGGYTEGAAGEILSPARLAAAYGVSPDSPLLPK